VPPRRGRLDAVLDRILDQRDQEVRWKRMVAQLARDFDAEAKAGPDAHLQDGQVLARELRFLAERRRSARSCGSAARR
jgi:hypothetical protein